MGVPQNAADQYQHKCFEISFALMSFCMPLITNLCNPSSDQFMKQLLAAHILPLKCNDMQ